MVEPIESPAPFRLESAVPVIVDTPARIWLICRRRQIPLLRRSTWRQLIGIGLGAVGAVGAYAQAHHIESASSGLIESGAPLFEVRNHQTLGLEAPPTDLHVLPDGRL
jgi:drug/metabolite transporter (DMT)-like permease